MSKKNNLRISLSFLLLIIVFASCQNLKVEEPNKKQASAKRPNILFIMSDDHAYQAISAYNSELIQTPNIDRIADQGIKFTKSFVTNSICAPSRAVILTGKFSHLNGITGNSAAFDGSQETFPKILQQNGYPAGSCEVVGKHKMHLPVLHRKCHQLH